MGTFIRGALLYKLKEDKLFQMTIIKDGNGVLIRHRVMIIGLSASSYKKIENDGFVVKGDYYFKLGADIDMFNKYLKRCK